MTIVSYKQINNHDEPVASSKEVEIQWLEDEKKDRITKQKSENKNLCEISIFLCTVIDWVRRPTMCAHLIREVLAILLNTTLT